jgi:hypothetical protein
MSRLTDPEPLRLADALNGVMVFGSTGSGKSTGAGRSLVEALFPVAVSPDSGEFPASAVVLDFPVLEFGREAKDGQ